MPAVPLREHGDASSVSPRSSGSGDPSTKMIGWGAAVPADKKAELIAYLVANFGPDNDKFEPTVTRPVGK